MTFEQLIKGNSVALVGPAEYMFSSKMGEEIDNHDLVVRLNRGIELTKENFCDVGKKSDILYSCLIEKSANAGKLNARELKDEYMVKYICAPPESTFEGIAKQTKFHYLVNMKTVQEISNLMPIRIVDHSFHTDLAQKVQCRPNTGFMAIYDLLRYQPRKLSIYGFSFYLDGFFPGCKKGIENEQNLSEKQFGERCYNSKRHIQKNMWLLAKQTLLNNNKVHLDPILNKILNLDDLDKKLFEESFK
ncbi:MAG TPA: hypothetical protein DEG69_11140 [Flavobacteriaceae bacterium]|nr:hypothetical protein [Flavobacteriaceae bacterium]